MRSSQPIYRPTYAEISLSNLEHNALWLKSLSPHFFCPMLKSHGYGHGDVEVAKRLSKVGIRTYGLALVEEAIRLRQGGLLQEELLVFGCFDQEGAAEIIKHKITPVLNLLSEVEQLQTLLRDGDNYPVHVKFNSGMYRLGFELNEASLVKEKIEKGNRLKIVGVCSHLSHGEDASVNDGRTQKQAQAVKELQSFFGSGVHYHLFNSPGGLSLWAHGRQQDILFGLRPGLALYGVAPDINFTDTLAMRNWELLPLRPVMRLRSGVVAYHHVEPGKTVSYGGVWTAERPSVIGTVPIGYADGYSRHFSNRGKMLFRGQRVPVIGKVCMDYTMVDLTDVLGRDFGQYAEEIVLIGNQEKASLSVAEVAGWADTISYEILTCVGRRVPRKYVD